MDKNTNKTLSGIWKQLINEGIIEQVSNSLEIYDYFRLKIGLKSAKMEDSNGKTLIKKIK